MLLYHSGLVHDHSLKAPVNHRLGTSDAHGGDYTWKVFYHFLLELLLVSHELLEFFLTEKLYFLQIVAEELPNLLAEFLAHSANVEDLCINGLRELISKNLLDTSLSVNNRRMLQTIVDLMYAQVEFTQAWKLDYNVQFDPALIVLKTLQIIILQVVSLTKVIFDLELSCL